MSFRRNLFSDQALCLKQKRFLRNDIYILRLTFYALLPQMTRAARSRQTTKAARRFVCLSLLRDAREPRAKVRCRKKNRMSCPNTSPRFRENGASGSGLADQLLGMIGRRQRENRYCGSYYRDRRCCERRTPDSVWYCSRSRHAEPAPLLGSSPLGQRPSRCKKQRAKGKKKTETTTKLSFRRHLF